MGGQNVAADAAVAASNRGVDDNGGDGNDDDSDGDGDDGGSVSKQRRKFLGPIPNQQLQNVWEWYPGVCIF